MSDLFIFDMGEVVITGVETLPQMAQLYGLDVCEFRADYYKYNTALMEGFMRAEDFYRHMELEYGIARIDEDLFYKYFSPKPNAFMLDIVNRLRARDHRVVIGSNTFEPHWSYMKERHSDILSSFDTLYASHEIHIAKPDPLFWRYIMKKEGFSSEHTVFIDDRDDNISTAGSLGITKLKYTKDDVAAMAFFRKWL